MSDRKQYMPVRKVAWLRDGGGPVEPKKGCASAGQMFYTADQELI